MVNGWSYYLAPNEAIGISISVLLWPVGPAMHTGSGAGCPLLGCSSVFKGNWPHKMSSSPTLPAHSPLWLALEAGHWARWIIGLTQQSTPYVLYIFLIFKDFLCLDLDFQKNKKCFWLFELHSTSVILCQPTQMSNQDAWWVRVFSSRGKNPKANKPKNLEHFHWKGLESRDIFLHKFSFSNIFLPFYFDSLL